MKTAFKKIVFSLAVVFCASCIAFADWDPGDPHKMHFPQLPNPQGCDVQANDPELADDFQCAESGAITDIHIWYSIFGDEYSALLNGGVVRIYDDIPAGGGGVPYSRPGELRWQWNFGMNDMVTRLYGDGLQGWYDPREPYWIPANHHNIWQLNLTNIPEPFMQEEGKIYWLAVQLNATFAMGWKTSLNYWNDTAVWRNAIGAPWSMLTDPMNSEPLSFAFVITNDGIVNEEIDFGDAPDGAAAALYPTLLTSNGARHNIVAGMFLGAAIDGEPDGQPTVNADGDDIDILYPPPNDDEDGVTFTTSLVPGQSATVNVVASVGGMLDAWVDFNADGSWTQAGDQIAMSVVLVPGNNAITFIVPATASLGTTYARFRFSSVGGLPPLGPAPDGEVEDYTVIIEEGIIPDPNIKYVQWPDTTPTGIDIRVDDGDGVTRHIADDFPCTTTGPITDVHFWGSWRGDEKGQINGFKISFYSDDPIGIGGSKPNNEYSMPDERLWTRTYLPGQFTETLYYTLPSKEFEWWWDPFFQVLIPNGDQNIWQYDIYIDPCDAFVQEGTPANPKIYWLEIEAWTPYGEPNNQFGWKTSNTHWNDDAVFANGSIYPWVSGWSELRYPPPHPNCPNSLDMAFMITTGGVHEEDYKWVQRPDLGETGIDVKATQPFILADDFQCTQNSLITEITVWGSWKYDHLPEGGPNDVAFTLSLHRDIPDPDGQGPAYSMPGETVWIKNFAPKTYNVKIERADIYEGWWSPENPQSYIFPGDHICWKYTFQIPANEAFCQEGTPELPVIYWLDVQAQPVDPIGEAEFGWKTSLQHWNDDAVWGQGMEPYPGPWNELIYPPMHQLQGNSIDLAFAIGGDLECPKADLGDAPDSTNTLGLQMTAYPGPGILANFPTVFVAGSPPYGPLHQAPKTAFYLGRGVSLENEADTGIDQDIQNNIDPILDAPNMDGSDDGVALPIKMPRCRLVKFNYNVTVIDNTQPIFANVWCDFNRDGDWDDVPMCGSKSAAEWAVVDQPLAFAAPGTYNVSTPPFRVYDDVNSTDIMDIWMRITLSETPAMQSGSGGSGPMAGYIYGETEDYFFTPDLSCSDCADFDLSGQVNWFDLKEFADNWLWTGGIGTMDADLDCDGDIEFVDFAILAEQWFLSCP